MRVAVVLIGCAACNPLFDIKDTRARDAGEIVVTIDVPDGTPRELQIAPPTLPANVFVSDRIPLAAVLHGPPNVSATLNAAAATGSITPATTMVTLDGNGIAPVDVTYTAASSAGPDTLTLTATAQELTAPEQDLMVTVNPLSSVGLDGHQANTQSVTAGTAIGIKITIGSPTVVRDFGMYATTASSGHVRMALYTAGSSQPGSLVVAASEQPVSAGRNVVPVTTTSIPAGDYWLLEVFDVATSVDWQAAGLYGAESFPYATTWPPSWNLQFIEVANTTFAMFMLVEM